MAYLVAVRIQQISEIRTLQLDGPMSMALGSELET